MKGKGWPRLVVFLTLALFYLGCAGAQVKTGDRIRILYSGDTWGTLVPAG